MKRIISSLSPFLIWPFFLPMAFSFVMSIVALVYEVIGWTEEKGGGLWWFIVFGGLFFILLWMLNRFICVICFKDEKITRKGLFGGFYKECPVVAIQKVVVKCALHEGDFIYLVDNSTHQFDRVRRDSYICFRKTKKNLEFLKSFWSGDIEEARIGL